MEIYIHRIKRKIIMAMIGLLIISAVMAGTEREVLGGKRLIFDISETATRPIDNIFNSIEGLPKEDIEGRRLEKAYYLNENEDIEQQISDTKVFLSEEGDKTRNLLIIQIVIVGLIIYAMKDKVDMKETMVI